MRRIKNIIRAALYPPVLLIAIFVLVSIVMLIYSMLVLGTESIISYISYAFSAYSLTIVCLRVPNMVNGWKTLKNENKYLHRWFSDAHFRLVGTLTISLIINVVYSLFQLVLGIYHKTFWYTSLAIYYFLLIALRALMLHHIRQYEPKEKMKLELHKYMLCGIAFLIMNLALGVIIVFMVYFDRTFIHSEITTIAMAAYTFTSLAFAIVGTVRYRKYDSPVFSASKAISLASAAVSMLTLTSTMLTAFGGVEQSRSLNRVMLSSLGGVVSIFIILMAIYMIANARARLREFAGTDGEMAAENN